MILFSALNFQFFLIQVWIFFIKTFEGNTAAISMVQS